MNIYNLQGKCSEIKKGISYKSSALTAHALAVAATTDALIEMNQSAIPTEVLGIFKPVGLLFALLHDVGKVSLPFQLRLPCNSHAYLSKLYGFAVNSPQFKLGIESSADYRHGNDGYMEYRRTVLDTIKDHSKASTALKEREWPLFDRYLQAAAAHHGFFRAADEEMRHRVPSNTEKEAAQQLTQWALDLVDELYPREIQCITQDLRVFKSLTLTLNCSPLIKLFAGWLSLSDWIGSNVDIGFQFVDSPTFIKNYATVKQQVALFNQYRSIARTFCQQSGMTGNTIQKSSFVKAVMGDYSPKVMQSYAIQKPIERGELVVCEAPTGSGKTEFSLLMAAHSLDSNEAKGVVFALPTQASANALYTRFEEAFGQLWKQGAAILHSQSKLVSDGDRDSTWEWKEWITDNNKKAFLRPSVFCTIDQLLLAQLNSKHSFIRFSALSQNVIIIDEVHSFDSYVEKGLISLLEFLGALQVPVILLSATLQHYKVQEYQKRYRNGAKCFNSKVSALPAITDSLPYPLITRYSTHHSIKPYTFDAPDKDYFFKSLPNKEWMAVLQEMTLKPKCIGLICNTVHSCVRRFHQLKKLQKKGHIPSDYLIKCIHARFTQTHRHQNEVALLDILSKNAQDRKPCIVVGTQVIEQSLDLDFDELLSEIAPIELLLQRLGRLRRHNRSQMGLLLPESEDDERGLPVFHIIVPDKGVATPTWYDNSVLVYKESMALAPTEAWLSKINDHQQNRITLPSEIRPIMKTIYPYRYANRDTQKKISGATASFDSLNREVQSGDRDANTRMDIDTVRLLLVKEDVEQGVCTLALDDSIEIDSDDQLSLFKHSLHMVSINRASEAYRMMENCALRSDSKSEVLIVPVRSVEDGMVRIGVTPYLYSAEMGMYSEEWLTDER